MSFNISTKMHNENIPKPEFTFASTNIFRQNFEYPKPMINYLKTIPTTMTPKLYINLLKSCKYFYSKTDLLVPLNNLDRYDLWKAISAKKDPFDYKLPFNIWLTRSYYTSEFHEISTDHEKYFLKNSVRCNLNVLTLYDQDITFKEFQFLTENGLKRFDCQWTVIKYCNDAVVPIEIIFAQLKEVQSVFYSFKKETAKLVTKETAEKLTKIIDTSKLETFILYGIPTIFNLETFKEFFKAHGGIRFDLYNNFCKS